MAFINCKECGSQIPESAASCTQCGAPVPQKAVSQNAAAGSDYEGCPFCTTVVHESATVCPGCGARKGYTRNGNRVYGKVATIGAGIGLPLFGTYVLPWLGIVLIPLMLFCIYRLVKGPVWYQII